MGALAGNFAPVERHCPQKFWAFLGETGFPRSRGCAPLQLKSLTRSANSSVFLDQMPRIHPRFTEMNATCSTPGRSDSAIRGFKTRKVAPFGIIPQISKSDAKWCQMVPNGAKTRQNTTRSQAERQCIVPNTTKPDTICVAPIRAQFRARTRVLSLPLPIAYPPVANTI